MDMRHPVRSLTWAVMRAIEQDLAAIDSPVANDLLNAEAGRITARPRIEDCSVVMFTQVWRGSDLGFERGGDRESVDAETVVITGPAGDACVYVSTQLLYRVGQPNRRFFHSTSRSSACEASGSAGSTKAGIPMTRRPLTTRWRAHWRGCALQFA